MRIEEVRTSADNRHICQHEDGSCRQVRDELCFFKAVMRLLLSFVLLGIVSSGGTTTSTGTMPTTESGEVKPAVIAVSVLVPLAAITIALIVVVICCRRKAKAEKKAREKMELKCYLIEIGCDGVGFDPKEQSVLEEMVSDATEHKQTRLSGRVSTGSKHGHSKGKKRNAGNEGVVPAEVKVDLNGTVGGEMVVAEEVGRESEGLENRLSSGDETGDGKARLGDCPVEGEKNVGCVMKDGEEVGKCREGGENLEAMPEERAGVVKVSDELTGQNREGKNGSVVRSEIGGVGEMGQGRPTEDTDSLEDGYATVEELGQGDGDSSNGEVCNEVLVKEEEEDSQRGLPQDGALRQSREDEHELPDYAVVDMTKKKKKRALQSQENDDSTGVAGSSATNSLEVNPSGAEDADDYARLDRARKTPQAKVGLRQSRDDDKNTRTNSVGKGNEETVWKTNDIYSPPFPGWQGNGADDREALRGESEGRDGACLRKDEAPKGVATDELEDPDYQSVDDMNEDSGLKMAVNTTPADVMTLDSVPDVPLRRVRKQLGDKDERADRKLGPDYDSIGGDEADEPNDPDYATLDDSDEDLYATVMDRESKLI